MKNIGIKLLILSLLTSLFVACDSEGVVRDYGVTAVQKLYAPDNGKAIVLHAKGSLTFEWEPALAEDGGNPLYEIIFDKENGDFSVPVAVIAADNNGGDNRATLTHKQINKVAAEAGVESAKQGTLKWTVYSSKGYTPVKAQEERTLTVTRLAGFADIPEQVYITGEATERGTNISDALTLRKNEDGEFEIYTMLKANAPFHFTNGTSEESITYSTSTDDGILVEGGSSSLTKEGVYRIILDFTTGSATYTLIDGIGFFYSSSNTMLFELPYIGNGIFQAKNQTVTFKQESWGKDERYKFRMYVRENAGKSEIQEMEWGTLNPTDSRPTPNSPDSYYYITLVNPSQWDNKWKLMGNFDGVPANYTIYLQVDKPYTHSVELSNAQGGNGSEEEDDDVIRILAIGNSFSEDAIEQYLYELANANNQEMIIANMYIGGSSLEEHATNAQNNTASYSYRKIIKGQKNSTENYTIENAVRDEKWDYISFQQVSQLSGQLDSYFPYLTNLIDYVKQFTTNPDVKFILHQTWAYAAHSTHSGFPAYNNDQIKMYNAIVDATEKAAERANIDILIPSGTAIQNGRTSIIGDTFDRDGYHLETTYGRFTVACTWYEVLTGEEVVSNSYTLSSITATKADIAKNAANLAVKKPKVITSMADKWGENLTVDSTRPIYINFGSSSSSGEGPAWNTMTSYEANSTINYLVDEAGDYTNVFIKVTDRFGGINGDGPTATQTTLNMPAWVSRNSFWGNGTGTFAGQSEPTGEFLISGLKQSKEYEFNIFSARSGANDNRETRFTIEGTETLSGDVNSSKNNSELVNFTLAPNSNGEVKLKAESGPNNTNNVKFFYINAISISPK
jgi:hypothetical protein